MKLSVVVIFSAFVLLSSCHSKAPALQASEAQPMSDGSLTEIAPGQFVPKAFTLTDQDGKSVSVASSKAPLTVVSFLFTHCTDTCPFLAVKLRALSELLGDKSSSVRLVLVSTDPERDTPSVLEKYTQEFGMDGKWHFLTGKPSEVKAVWDSFHIAVAKQLPDAKDSDADDSGPSPEAGLDSDQTAFGSKIAKTFGGGYDVVHTTSFLILDASGSVRAILGAETSPTSMKDEVVRLLGSS